MSLWALWWKWIRSHVEPLKPIYIFKRALQRRHTHIFYHEHNGTGVWAKWFSTELSAVLFWILKSNPKWSKFDLDFNRPDTKALSLLLRLMDENCRYPRVSFYICLSPTSYWSAFTTVSVLRLTVIRPVESCLYSSFCLLSGNVLRYDTWSTGYGVGTVGSAEPKVPLRVMFA